MRNKSILLNIVLLVVVIILSCRLVYNNDSATGGEDAVLDNIATRTSIRDYQQKSVEKDKLIKCCVPEWLHLRL